MNDVRPGDRVTQRAEDHNKVARIARHFDQYPLPVPQNPRGAGDGRIFGYNPTASIMSGPRVAAITGNVFDPALVSDELDPDCAFARHIQYDLAVYDSGYPERQLCVVLDDIKAGGFGEILLSGVAQMLVNISNADHLYAKVPDDGDGTALESAASGPFRIVSQPSGTGAKWCTVQFPAGRPENIHAADADNAFTIDRTSEADDAAAWNPGANEPADWADYDCVKLIFGFLRYDSTAGTLKHVKQEMHWHAANAPIIPAAEIVDADVGVCDSAGGGEEEPPA